MTSTKYSISEVNRRTGISRTTLRKHIKKRIISSEQDDRGRVLLESSELERVYGKRWTDTFTIVPSTQNTAGKGKTEQGVQQEVDKLREQLDKEIVERSREREYYRQQIDHLQDTLKLAQEGQNRVTKLLEDRSSEGGGWETVTKNLQEQIANQEIELEERFAKFREDAKREAMAEIKDKYWWQVLFAS